MLQRSQVTLRIHWERIHWHILRGSNGMGSINFTQVSLASSFMYQGAWKSLMCSIICLDVHLVHQYCVRLHLTQAVRDGADYLG